MSSRSQIYWANAMFSEADRDFNARTTARLRSAGYSVFLPQEDAVNADPTSSTPSAADVFSVDTRALLRSQLLIACIDHDAIDSGVACEVGIARSAGIPTICLYTDIRQHRVGSGRMYKNLYVLGALEASGPIVSRSEDLFDAIEACLRLAQEKASSAFPETDHIRHYDAIAERYLTFANGLSQWYNPPWSSDAVVRQYCPPSRSLRLLEYGCGPGKPNTFPISACSVFYLGYDPSTEMIRIANLTANPDMRFTSDWSQVVAAATEAPFDVALVRFALHEHPDHKSALSGIARCLRPGGTIILVDLSTWDLPILTRLLQDHLLTPLRVSDSRIEATSIARLADSCGLILSECRMSTPAISFPTLESLTEYLDIFGIPEGMDLPLGLTARDSAQTRASIARLLSQQTFPFEDRRAFIICTLQLR